jgi:predicted MFS family arabinose efflux permease
VLSLFSVKQFCWLFMGNVAFFFAMQGQMLTRSLLAWDLTGEATALAYINLVVAVPMIFASLLGGAITDRVERRQLIIIGQTLIAANEIFILVLLLLGKLEFWHMLCTAFVTGCAFPFIMPARMAITMAVVGPQRLQSALAFTSGAMNLNRVLGPAVMGVIIAQWSFTAAFILSSSLYFCAIACMFGIKRNHSMNREDVKKPLLVDIAHGFSYIRQNRPVLICLLFGLIPMFLAMPFQNILVMLAEEVWAVGESGVGTLMATGGVGGVIGAIWIVKRGDSAKRLNVMLGSTLAFGIFLALFTQTSNFYYALIPLLIANTCASASQAVNNASIQLLIEDKVRGRISSFMMLSFGLTPIGVFPMALAADRAGAANAILAASLILILVVVGFFLFSKTLRDLDESVADALKKPIKKSTG